MFNNCYRQGYNYDMNRCNCPKCRQQREEWDNDFDKEEDFENDYCCFPVDLNLSIKENRKEERVYYDFDQERQDQNHERNDDFEQKDCKKECCFPIDVCLSIKEGKRCEKHNNRKDNCNHNWKENDRCNCNKNNCHNNRPYQNRNNNCCLGFLAGYLFGCRRY